MALRLTLKDLIRATLPQGGGQMGFIGISPAGDEYHLLVPVDLDRAQVLSASSAPGRGLGLGPLGARPGWLYLPCRTYQPPSSCLQGRPEAEAFIRARRAQALLTAAQIADWAEKRGWWVKLE